MYDFQEDTQKFNAMYRLPVAARPTLGELGETAAQRLRNFVSILREELEEFTPILAMLDANQLVGEEHPQAPYPDLEILTALADLLGDIQVYCASEMRKFGLPQDEVLAIIMQSNFSKLGADGKPIYDERGKVQKGPGYWRPEPALAALLDTQMRGPGHADAHALLLRHQATLAASRAAPGGARTGLAGAFDPQPSGVLAATPVNDAAHVHKEQARAMAIKHVEQLLEQRRRAMAGTVNAPSYEQLLAEKRRLLARDGLTEDHSHPPTATGDTV